MKRKKRISIPVTVLLVLVTACVWYVNDYYRAEAVVQEYLTSSESVTVSVENNIVFLDGSGEEHAIIFYPGAKVEYTAYVPLFYRLAEQGIDCFIVKMPANLAILGQNRAADIMEDCSYENWYVSGHSLGGAMISGFAAEHAEKLKGLVLLAAYPTKNLIDSGLSVLSLYGSEDKVLNMENFTEGRNLMPEAYTERCIVGGNHAWFAYYGDQEGDGTAVITKEEQQKQAIDEIIRFVFQKEDKK